MGDDSIYRAVLLNHLLMVAPTLERIAGPDHKTHAHVELPLCLLLQGLSKLHSVLLEKHQIAVILFLFPKFLLHLPRRLQTM